MQFFLSISNFLPLFVFAVLKTFLLFLKPNLKREREKRELKTEKKKEERGRERKEKREREKREKREKEKREKTRKRLIFFVR